jgi:hypothetical protein
MGGNSCTMMSNCMSINKIYYDHNLRRMSIYECMNATKMYREMEPSCQLHAQATYLRGKSPLWSLNRRYVAPGDSLDNFEWRKMCCSCWKWMDHTSVIQLATKSQCWLRYPRLPMQTNVIILNGKHLIPLITQSKKGFQNFF